MRHTTPTWTRLSVCLFEQISEQKYEIWFSSASILTVWAAFLQSYIFSAVIGWISGLCCFSLRRSTLFWLIEVRWAYCPQARSINQPDLLSLTDPDTILPPDSLNNGPHHYWAQVKVYSTSASFRRATGSFPTSTRGRRRREKLVLFTKYQIELVNHFSNLITTQPLWPHICHLWLTHFTWSWLDRKKLLTFTQRVTAGVDETKMTNNVGRGLKLHYPQCNPTWDTITCIFLEMIRVSAPVILQGFSLRVWGLTCLMRALVAQDQTHQRTELNTETL